MKRILVTGGLGFIGSNLIDSLISKHLVTVIDDFSTGQVKNVSRHLKNPNFRLVRGSILDDGKVDEALDNVEAVVHLAAIASVAQSERNPQQAHRVNVEGTLKILECSRKHSVERVVFASSAAVYGRNLAPPLREDFPTNPCSVYGATKEAGEAYCRAYNEKYGLKTTALRLMNVYGPQSLTGPYAGVIAKFAEAILARKPLIIHGNGEQTRDLFTLKEGSKSKIRHVPFRPGDVDESYADISMARQILSYEPNVTLEKGIPLFMQWYEKESG